MKINGILYLVNIYVSSRFMLNDTNINLKGIGVLLLLLVMSSAIELWAIIKKGKKE